MNTIFDVIFKFMRMLIAILLFTPFCMFSQKMFSVKYQSQADKKIYFVDYASQSDLKIFFTKYSSQSGWRKKEKVHLLY